MTMANAKILMADTINRFAKDYESMVKAAEFLKEVGINEQIADEHKAAAEAARKEAEAANEELAVAKAAVKTQKAKCAEMLADNETAIKVRNAEVQAMLDKAEAESAAQSAGILAAARDAADKVTAAVAADVKSLETTKFELFNEIHQAELTLVAKAAEVEALEARLLKAQASIAKLLG